MSYTEKNKVQKVLCTSTRKQLWSEVANENIIFTFKPSNSSEHKPINLIKNYYSAYNQETKSANAWDITILKSV